ncbi:sigma-E factor negative regulatory protein [Natronospira bacteriovora]|uniref:Sigma-E factor negative regulatory protein n=1 Tax=Natronospira bacteriovora TaxID=3069753 RepID=A0ABU0W3C7_9GAMM|nr:sigma-E factor negative regulatory protein [Natronospira sp. AB-CW4]MDQ2068293.1 sigma-E factor negative regulatory protein [Natronospira sp. AB-CW4]
MSERLREQISALMDGELDDGEARLLVRRFEKDPELRDVWDRYQRCARLVEAGADSGMTLVGPEFSRSVMAGIEREHASTAPPPRWREWLRPVAGLAVAAGVATVALIGLQGEHFNDVPERVEVVPGAASEASPWPASARFSPASAGTRLSIEDSDPWQRLHTYRVNHTDQAAGLRRIEQDEPDSRDESEESGANPQ